MALRPTRHPGVLTDGRRLYTENLVPGVAVYGERLLRHAGREFRAWNPRRSKLAALLLLGADPLDLPPDAAVLYLGAGTGTTLSHLSDLLPRGTLAAVEVSRTSFEKLLRLAEARRNVVPFLADARRPEAYRSLVGPVDLLYQDVAQRDQARIFLRNAPLLRPSGRGLLMVKARSVDAAAVPEDVFRREGRVLQEGGLAVEAVVPLEPYQADHAAFLVRPRNRHQGSNH